MEYPTTNLIHFPQALPPSPIDPNPPVPIGEILAPEMARLIEEMKTLTPARAAEIERLKKVLGIPANISYGSLDLPYLHEAEWQLTECPKCGGRTSAPCKKMVFDADWKLREIPCPAKERLAKAAKAQRLMSTAGIPARFRDIRAGVDFEVTKGNLAAVRAAENCIDRNSGLYVYGAAGVGKTMLACVIANERARIGRQSLFITVPDMLEELRDFDKPEARAAKLKLLYETPCLIVDDLGAEKATQWAAETLFRVFNSRYNSELQTIVTSNFSLDRIAERMTDYAGERVVRRIRAICLPVFMER